MPTYTLRGCTAADGPGVAQAEQLGVDIGMLEYRIRDKSKWGGKGEFGPCFLEKAIVPRDGWMARWLACVLAWGAPWVLKDLCTDSLARAAWREGHVG